MALPSSGQMAMTAVATEFSVSSTNISLSNLGTKLSEPITAGNEVELATDFYGQSAVTLTSFTAILDSEGDTFGSSEAACNAEETTQYTYYHDGSGTFPSENDNVYTNSGGTTSAADGYIKWSPGRGFQYTNIESGEAGLPGIC